MIPSVVLSAGVIGDLSSWLTQPGTRVPQYVRSALDWMVRQKDRAEEVSAIQETLAWLVGVVDADQGVFHGSPAHREFAALLEIVNHQKPSTVAPPPAEAESPAAGLEEANSQALAGLALIAKNLKDQVLRVGLEEWTQRVWDRDRNDLSIQY